MKLFQILLLSVATVALSSANEQPERKRRENVLVGGYVRGQGTTAAQIEENLFDSRLLAHEMSMSMSMAGGSKGTKGSKGGSKGTKGSKGGSKGTKGSKGGSKSAKGSKGKGGSKSPKGSKGKGGTKSPKGSKSSGKGKGKGDRVRA
jgi:hypothetical protein